MVEAPGTAPGSATLISQAIYRHSRLPDTRDIGCESHKGNCPLRLCVVRPSRLRFAKRLRITYRLMPSAIARHAEERADSVGARLEARELWKPQWR